MSRSLKTILHTFLDFLILFGLLPEDRCIRFNVKRIYEISTPGGALMSAGHRHLTRSDFLILWFTPVINISDGSKKCFPKQRTMD